MAGKYSARIAGVLRWLGSAVLNINRKDREQALLSRHEALDDQMSELYDAYRALLELSPESEYMDKINADVNQADDLADQIRQAVGVIQNKYNNDSPCKYESDNCSPALISRLPKLDLPHFNGDLRQWVAYNNLFDSLVHSRKDLTAAQKLAYLLASLTGEAKGLVQHLDIVDANYDIARLLLQRRYQNVRRLADTHMSAILALPTLRTTHALRLQLLNPLLVAINGLKGLNLPVTTWSFILLHIVLNKLPLELRNRFEQEYGGDSATDLPQFDNLILFLEDECRRLENVLPPEQCESNVNRHKVQQVRDRRAPAKLRDVRAYNTVSTPQQISRCAYCKGSNHGVSSCAKFKNLRWQARRNIVRQRNWCFGCLGNHFISQCQSAKPCHECQGRHHLLLCDNRRKGSPGPAAPAPMVVAEDTRVNLDNQWTGGAQVVPPRNSMEDSADNIQSSDPVTGGASRHIPRMVNAAIDQARRMAPDMSLQYAECPRLDRRYMTAMLPQPSYQHWNSNLRQGYICPSPLPQNHDSRSQF